MQSLRQRLQPLRRSVGRSDQSRRQSFIRYSNGKVDRRTLSETRRRIIIPPPTTVRTMPPTHTPCRDFAGAEAACCADTSRRASPNGPAWPIAGIVAMVQHLYENRQMKSGRYTVRSRIAASSTRAKEKRRLGCDVEGVG